tara:strand:- start:101 stop:310 length:210 start_codon:yes stop_codon:yes gene_type:complete
MRTTASESGTQLVLQTKDGRSINRRLERKLLYSLLDLLTSSTKKAEWNLDLSVAESPAAAAPEQDGPVH